MDGEYYAGGDCGGAVANGLVCGAKAGGLASDFDSDGDDATDKSALYCRFGLVAVVCIVCGNFDFGANFGGVFLWTGTSGEFGGRTKAKEAECAGRDDAGERGGDGDVRANFNVLFWVDFGNFCGGEFVDSADNSLGDGADVLGGRGWVVAAVVLI